MSRFIRVILVFFILLFTFSFISCDIASVGNEYQQEQIEEPVAKYNYERFNNPISEGEVADPFITYDPETEYYYCLFTLGDRLEIYRHHNVADIFTEGESKVIYRATGENDVWGDIWAPEMHRANDGLWYIYTSSRVTPEPGEKRIFILSSLTDDPFGEWEFKSRPTPDVFSIDPTVYSADNGKQYICYSKVDPEYGQVLEIAEMLNPYTFSQGNMIAHAELDWELVEPYTGSQAILEGAFFLESEGRLFLIYSANGCWSNHYALGVLEYTGEDICSPEGWKKHLEPLLTYDNGVYGPGHASFFYSPDGSEIWCAYHGMLESNDDVKPASRYCNIQKVEFDLWGYPIMGVPVGYNDLMCPPSGEVE